MLVRLNYFWRVIATGLCFFIFGFGGLVLSVIVLPIQKIVIKNSDTQKHIARKTVHYAFKFFIAVMSFLGIFTFDLSKAKQLKSLKGSLILANHPSLIDVVVLISQTPNANCIVKTHLFKNIFIRGVISNTGYISNDDPEELILDCQNTLDSGNNLIIFPQGTRCKTEMTLKFQRGAANIAVRCKAKVTAVLLSVIPTTLTKNEPWYSIPLNEKASFSAIVIDQTPTIPENTAAQISRDVRDYNRTLENFFKKELSKHE